MKVIERHIAKIICETLNMGEAANGGDASSINWQVKAVAQSQIGSF